MAKGGGTTRTSSSSNPRGVGNSATRSTEDQVRLMDTRDRITSLEYERDNLRMAGAPEEQITALTAQIADLREVVRRMERNESTASQQQTSGAFASRTQMTSAELIAAFKKLTGKNPTDVNTVKIHYQDGGEPVHVSLYRHAQFMGTGLGVGMRGNVEWRGEEGTRLSDLSIDDTEDLRITYKDSEGMHSVRISDLNKKKRR